MASGGLGTEVIELATGDFEGLGEKIAVEFERAQSGVGVTEIAVEKLTAQSTDQVAQETAPDQAQNQYSEY
ncbi:MAG TPA: hypothetical protein VJ796_01420 [Acidimicrobiia bacterium]|jgi:hypothetical protein|nr:hypothetical protein [Acidimicrobiia bacterium]